MANSWQVETLKRSVKAWNEWREKNRDVKVNLAGVDLSYMNLAGIDLSEADLSKTNLSRANLKYANLSRVQALDTNFESAILTGACIQDWNINQTNQFNSVVCEFFFLNSGLETSRELFPSRIPPAVPSRLPPSFDFPSRQNFHKQSSLYTDRRPSDPAKTFAPGDFARLVQKAQETVDLIFREGIDWQAFSNSFQALKTEQIKVEGSDRNFSVRAIENLDDGSFVVRINTPSNADKAEIEQSFQAKYEEELQRLEGTYREKLQCKDEQIEQYKRENTNLWVLVQREATRSINVENRNIIVNSDTIQGSAYTQGDNQVNTDN